MVLKDFYYELPEELIAQTPIEKRDMSRLLTLDRKTGKTEHRIFKDIVDYLNPGDCLILNNSKVLPARIYGIKEGTGAKIEIVLLEQKHDNIWEVLVRPGKKLRIGTAVVIGDGMLKAKIVDEVEGGNRLADFSFEGNFYNVLEKVGQMPLPPYIKEKLKDNNRYQTIYAKVPGSAAAPTAGLHFTQELLDQIKNKGVKIAYVTLHVGLGTFRPVKVDNITDHKMHSEHYFIPQETADIINTTKANGKRVIAVGTTSCRTLETAGTFYEGIKECEGFTDIFIYPGYKFKVIDALITNFHLPESTLIMLVSAFANREMILKAYQCAIDERYKFFSFGDAMFIY